MVKTKKATVGKSNWNLLGHVSSWIVGSQYCDEKINAGEQVFLEPEPGNPVDASAMAVFSLRGKRAGYIPRYDAAILTPAVNDGMVLLKGLVENTASNGRLGLRLEVHASPKAEKWFDVKNGDDVKDILHNTFLAVWNRREEYSSATLMKFRDMMRGQAHEQRLHTETAVIYRLLRGAVDDKIKAENTRCREALRNVFASIEYGNASGCRVFAVYPLFAPGNAPKGKVSPTDFPVEIDFTSENMVSYYAYPQKAQGMVICANGVMKRICWFASTAEMQMHWFALLTESQKYIKPSAEILRPNTVKRLKWALNSILENSVIIVESPGRQGELEISIVHGFIGRAILNRDGMLVAMDVEIEDIRSIDTDLGEIVKEGA